MVMISFKKLVTKQNRFVVVCNIHDQKYLVKVNLIITTVSEASICLAWKHI